jgi:hypothetical protein
MKNLIIKIKRRCSSIEYFNKNGKTESPDNNAPSVKVNNNYMWTFNGRIYRENAPAYIRTSKVNSITQYYLY